MLPFLSERLLFFNWNNSCSIAQCRDVLSCLTPYPKSLDNFGLEDVEIFQSSSKNAFDNKSNRHL